MEMTIKSDQYLARFWTFPSYNLRSTFTIRITLSIAITRPPYMWQAKFLYSVCITKITKLRVLASKVILPKTIKHYLVKTYRDAPLSPEIYR